MSAENKQLLRKFFTTVLEKGDLSILDEMVAPSFVDHQPAPEQGPGIEGVKQFVKGLRGGITGLQVEVEHLISEGNFVAAHVTMRGRHTGKLMGMPPSGKDVVIRIADVVRIENGKIAERWGIEDMSGLMTPAA